MIRGVRGATTILKNSEEEILKQTEYLLREMVSSNDIVAESISHIIITTTDDITATFPAKAVRNIDGFKYVPVMCMKELSIDQGLPLCIRIMLTVNTNKKQEEINHIYKNKAISLRPDLTK